MALTTIRVKVGDRWYTAQVGDLSHSPVEVAVEGETYYVEVDGLPPRPPPRPRLGRPPSRQPTGPTPQSRAVFTSPSERILRSPMPGRVLSIRVRPGDRVAPGDEVCVVEAMKMEQTIRSSRDGVVKTVHVQPMDSVSANDPLIELE